MKKYTWTLLFFTVLSCFQKHDLSKAIKGNWQIHSNSTIDSILYTEVYIDSSHIHIYMNPVGLVPSSSYYIKNDSIHIKEFSSTSFINAGKVSVEKNLLKISNKKGVLTYRKLDVETGLDGLKNNETDMYDFGPVFYDRMEDWKMERENTLK